MDIDTESIIYRRFSSEKSCWNIINLRKHQQKTIYGYQLAVEIKKLTLIEVAEVNLYPRLNRLKRYG